MNNNIIKTKKDFEVLPKDCKILHTNQYGEVFTTKDYGKTVYYFNALYDVVRPITFKKTFPVKDLNFIFKSKVHAFLEAANFYRQEK